MPDIRLSHRQGLHLIKKEERLPSPFFRAGELIPESGVYRAFHSAHRASPAVTLASGPASPRCTACGSDVHFAPLHSAPGLAHHPTSRRRPLLDPPPPA